MVDAKDCIFINIQLIETNGLHKLTFENNIELKIRNCGLSVYKEPAYKLSRGRVGDCFWGKNLKDLPLKNLVYHRIPIKKEAA